MEYLTSLFYSPGSTHQQHHDVKFFIHDEEHLVKAVEYPPTMTLLEYIRHKSDLKGTKHMCWEGGCGACVVVAEIQDPITQRTALIAVNSCLVLIYSCSGWKIYTSDKIGDPQLGYHPIQKAMVKFNGTQCGYCTSGMIMNMYALYESKSDLTMKEVENSFGGNICRCTGYRSILTAFKSLASDAPPEIIGTSSDIEDILVCKKENCRSTCENPCGQIGLHYFDNGSIKWYKAYYVNEVLDIIRDHSDRVFTLIAGNTASGVYMRSPLVEVYIDVTSVKSLLEHTILNDKLILGANITLTNTINLFRKLSAKNQKFAYLDKLADHIDLVAHVPVRNMGTLAGNLFTKHEHKEFSSDIFLILETVGATLTLINTSLKEVTKTPFEFLSWDMKNSIIKNITLPSLDESFKYESYKIMPVAQNAHAMLNAGFLLQLDDKNKVISARIVYGGINPEFAHAGKAEDYLVGKDIFSDATLQGVFKSLDEELKPDHVLPDPSPIFRKNLAISLLYKFVLSITPDGKISPVNKSGGKKQTRPLSSGTYSFGTNTSMYPLTQPVSKVEALAQCTGKAEYLVDIPDRPDQLFAAFVLAKAPPHSVIEEVDASTALKLEGVTAYYDKKDIPGENTFTPKEAGPWMVVVEELFCSGIVKFYYQPIGIIVATSVQAANQAANLVKVTYVAGKEEPLLTIRDILKNNATQKIFTEQEIDAKTKGKDVSHVVKGDFNIGWQYHYNMETQCCVVDPVEDGLNIYAATQDMNLTQVSAAKLLNISMNKINVVVRRLGGAYGSKIIRSAQISCAAALAAHKLGKSVKFFLSLKDNMNVVGKRFPFFGDYEVGIDNSGVIQYLNTSAYTDLGNSGGNENVKGHLMEAFTSCYKSDTFNAKLFSTRTDNHTGSWCRSPCTMEGIAYMESIMQHIAVSQNLDPITMRLKNIENAEMKQYLNDFVEWAEVRKRQEDIAKFNEENRWVKRGLAVVPMIFPLHFMGTFHVHVSIFQGDGSVAVTHGGIEMGQGINTKVVQVCAFGLKIPMEMVSVKPKQSSVCPNDFISGGSITSESVCLAILKACELLNARMKPIRDKMKEPIVWKDLVQQCHQANIDLCGSFMFHPKLLEIESYPIYGVSCVEAEVDVLTGLRQITRVDILEDTGDSLSPNIDIGQIEGGFLMGLGYWTSEELVYNSEGKLLTNRTWNYKPPGMKDIPVDFRMKLPKNNPFAPGVLNSKATAEPPTCMSIAAALAIKDAVASARVDSSAEAEKWYPIDGPCTVENTFLNSLSDYSQYKL